MLELFWGCAGSGRAIPLRHRPFDYPRAGLHQRGVAGRGMSKRTIKRLVGKELAGFREL